MLSRSDVVLQGEGGFVHEQMGDPPDKAWNERRLEFSGDFQRTR
jgi:hypothetical protein